MAAPNPPTTREGDRRLQNLSNPNLSLAARLRAIDELGPGDGPIVNDIVPSSSKYWNDQLAKRVDPKLDLEPANEAFITESPKGRENSEKLSRRNHSSSHKQNEFF